MLVSKRHKKLVLNVKDPGRICALLPKSRQIDYKGKTLVAVNHTLENAQVLRGIGIKAPSPILHYYGWPGKTPFEHQGSTAEFLTLHPRAFCLNGMGTGKTLSALWAFHYLLGVGMLDWCVIVSPLSTLERAWGDEIFRTFEDLSFGVLYGDQAKRMKILKQPHQAYIVNHDGLKNKQLLYALMKKEGRGLVIIDELATYRNASTDRWKAANYLINGYTKKKKGVVTHHIPGRGWAWGLTGTPIPNEPTDAWAQCRLIRPASVPSFFGAFRDMVMDKKRMFVFEPKPDALQTVLRVMQPSIRFSREECLDLPPTTYLDRHVELTPEQKRMYKEMVSKLKTEYEQHKITALNEVVKLGKLLQIVCGVAYGKDGEVSIPAQPRIDEVIANIESAQAKVIVFAPLTGALNAFADKLRDRYTVSVVYGETSKTQRDEIFADFQRPDGAQVLVAQPGTMAHGLSLVAADTIIWYAPTNSSETYQQANARIVRPGQLLNTRIVRIEGSPMERKMYARLEKRESTQGILLDLFADV